MQLVWAEIDLAAAANNYRFLRAHIPSCTRLCCVVKADAYGHGAISLAQLWEKLGADYFAVANLEEGISLRQAGIRAPILILGYTPPLFASALIEHNFTQTVYSLSYAQQLNHEASILSSPISIHIKIDTGMGRIGFRPRGALKDSLLSAGIVAQMPSLILQGVYTHFAIADDSVNGKSYTEQQYAAFTKASTYLEEIAGNVLLRHCANSAASLNYPYTCADMVRLGIALYGIQPCAKPCTHLPLSPVLTLKTIVMHSKEINCGDCIGYGCTYTAHQKMRIATLPIGYADGIQRLWGAHGVKVTIRGVPCPFVGRISMNQCTIDVSALPPLECGEEVTVLGVSSSMTASTIAELCGTIPYEILCGISSRIPRVYLQR